MRPRVIHADPETKMPTPPMIDDLSLKPGFADTVRRFEAWWDGEVTDRPPVTTRVTPSRPSALPEPPHESLEARWLDPEYQVDRRIDAVLRRDYPGDALPIVTPDVGPELTSTLWGADLEFGETTSWSKPIVTDAARWRDVADRAPDYDNRYWQASEAMTRLALEKCEGRYLVGVVDLHGNYDILAGLREPELLCMDLVDDPEAVDAAARRAAAAFVDAFERNYALVAESGQGSTSWVPMYHRGPAYVPSCDFWCMLGERHARELVMPRIVEEMGPMERSIFHLDGPQALRHLDLLLELDELDAVQWVYGAGNGAAADWIDVYRRIRDGGKAIQVIATSGDDALAVLDAVGPSGVWLDVHEAFAGVDEAEAFLAEVERRSRGHG